MRKKDKSICRILNEGADVCSCTNGVNLSFRPRRCNRFFHTVEEEKKNRIWWIFFVNCRAHTLALLSLYYCISLVAQHTLFGCSQARPELRCKRTVTLIFYGFLITSALLPYLSIMFRIIHLLAQVYVNRVIHGVIQMLGPTEMRHICCETWASPASFKLRKSP